MHKTNISLKQRQKLKLAPKLQQSLSLLALSSVEFEALITQALDDNPLLEKITENTEENSQIITAQIYPKYQYEDIDDKNIWETIENKINFHDFLHQQVIELSLSKRQSILVHILIDHLDDHGYLDFHLSEIIEYLPLELMVEENELKEALHILQTLDPAGIGAKNLQESLLLQAMRIEDGNIKQCALEILHNHFHIISQPNEFHKLKTKLKINSNILLTALKIIHEELNPYPNNGYNDSPTQFIIPDIHVIKKNNHWTVKLSNEIPRIQTNLEFTKQVETLADPVWQEKLSHAKEMIELCDYRNKSILSVAKYIVTQQQAFFNTGSSALIPLKQKDVALALSIHISTVSRSINKKYLASPLGIFELKYFFSPAIKSDHQDDTVSTHTIKNYIQKWIAQEDKYHPLSDTRITEQLIALKIQIARRTIAKYREELNIPPACRRKIR